MTAGRFVSLCFLAGLAVGCAASHPTGSAHVSAPAVVEFARVADPKETVVRTVARGGQEVRLAEVRHFGIARAYPSQDELGYPAVAFELADADRQAFSEWTGSMLNKGLAILVDGEPVTIVTVKSKLPGGGHISFVTSHRTAEEVRALAERIVTHR